jgi:hypothetical protein
MASIKPCDIHLTDDPIVQDLINTLGRAEHEFVAALIVRWHHVHELAEWTPVSRDDIVTLFEPPAPIVAAWGGNQFWRPDPHAFEEAGFIVGWRGTAASKGTLTPLFFEKIEAEHSRRRALAETRLVERERRRRRWESEP